MEYQSAIDFKLIQKTLDKNTYNVQKMTDKGGLLAHFYLDDSERCESKRKVQEAIKK